MPGPPPPPPGPPPPPSFGLPSSSKSGDDGRGLLLQSIRQGTQLKKTTTNDRSAPQVVNNKPAANSSSGSPLRPGGISNNSSGMTNGGLGGLFAGGMPKLKPTGRGRPTAVAAKTDSGLSSNSSTPATTPSRGPNAVPAGGARRPFTGDVKNRGPPPQPPPAAQKPSLNMNSSEETVGSNATKFAPMTNNRNGPPSLPSKPPVGGYGKPNVAPRPPPLNDSSKPSPPPKKLFVNGTENQNRVSVTRAQSMRVPRSPPVAPPTPPFPPSKELGRGGSVGYPSFHQSQDSLPTYHSNPPPRTATLPSNLNHHGGSSKSLAPPPPVPTGNKPVLRPPLCRPPPPPSRPPPPPTHAPPPPPPHKTGPAPSPLGSQNRLAPQQSLGFAPPPPPSRSSSMRNGDLSATGNFEARFADYFHLVHEFPKPPEFMNVTKVYNSNNVKLQAATSGKQQAPQPPMIQLEKKMWASNSSNC